MTTDKKIDIFIAQDPSSGANGSNDLSSKKTIDKPRPHPWRRFLARFIDIYFSSIIVTLVSYIFVPVFLERQYVVAFGLVNLFFWIFLETIFLSLIGYTPGKWLLKISVLNEKGSKPRFFQTLKRSFSVWFFGLAMGIPLVNLITLLVSYFDINANGVTRWDRKGNFHVTCLEMSGARILLAAVVCMAVVIFTVIMEIMMLRLI